jgi:hypothetical protein
MPEQHLGAQTSPPQLARQQHIWVHYHWAMIDSHQRTRSPYASSNFLTKSSARYLGITREIMPAVVAT